MYNHKAARTFDILSIVLYVNSQDGIIKSPHGGLQSPAIFYTTDHMVALPLVPRHAHAIDAQWAQP